MKRILVLLAITLLLVDVAIYKKYGKKSQPRDSISRTQPNYNGKSEPLPPERPDPSRPKKQYIPEFVNIQVYRKSEDGTVYGDILSHVQGAPFGDEHGRSTNAHETTHGINSEIRNSYYDPKANKSNGFYVLQGRGVVLEEPKIKMQNALRFVPQNLRSYRWRLYMEQQIKDWNDTPTYIFDEWVAYVNGGACGVDDVKKGKHKEGWTDAVSGCCDFSFYAIALAMATKNDDPEYWEKYPQFKNFVIWELKFAQKTFMEGRVMKDFKWETQDRLLLEFLTSKDAEAMREFCRSELDGVWVDIDPDEIRKMNYDGTPKLTEVIVTGGCPCSLCGKK